MSQPFRNPAEAKKQGRVEIGTYPYYGTQAVVYSALPREDMAKLVGKKISLSYHDDPQGITAEYKTVVAAGYDDTGGCFPCVKLDNGIVECLSNLGLKEWKVF